METGRNAESAREDDIARVSREIEGRLLARGIVLDGSESLEQLARIEEAVERFEEAVEKRGGDLMVDEGPGGHTREPDDPHFALPVRRADESIPAYLDRLARATEVVRHHPDLP